MATSGDDRESPVSDEPQNVGFGWTEKGGVDKPEGTSGSDVGRAPYERGPPFLLSQRDEARGLDGRDDFSKYNFGSQDHLLFKIKNESESATTTPDAFGDSPFSFNQQVAPLKEGEDHSKSNTQRFDPSRDLSNQRTGRISDYDLQPGQAGAENFYREQSQLDYGYQSSKTVFRNSPVGMGRTYPDTVVRENEANPSGPGQVEGYRPYDNSTYNRDMHHFRVTNGPGYSGSQRSSPNDIGENSQFRDGSYGGRGSQRNSPLDFPQASHFRESGVSPHFRESPLLASGARSPQDPAEVAYTRERERDLQSSQLPRSSPSMSGGTASNRTTPEISGGSQVSSSAASVLNKPARASPSSMSANAPPYPYGGRPQEDPVAPQSTLQRLTSAMNMPVRGQGRLLGRGAPQGPPGNGRYPQGDFNMKDVEHALDGVVGAQRHDDVQYNAYYNDGYRPQHYDGEDGHFVPEGPPRSHMGSHGHHQYPHGGHPPYRGYHDEYEYDSYGMGGGGPHHHQQHHHQGHYGRHTQVAPPTPAVVSGFDGFVYKVQFKRTHRNFLRSSTIEQPILTGDFVIVEADRGEDLGVVCEVQPMPIFFREGGSLYSKEKAVLGSGEKQSGVKHILRHAQAHEYSLLPVKMAEEQSIVEVCRERALGVYLLPMTVCDAEYQFDRHKLTIYYESHRYRRIDFRELVRDMFAVYKTRIWMEHVSYSFRPDEMAARALATGMPQTVASSPASFPRPAYPPSTHRGGTRPMDRMSPQQHMDQQQQHYYPPPPRSGVPPVDSRPDDHHGYPDKVRQQHQQPAYGSQHPTYHHDEMQNANRYGAPPPIAPGSQPPRYPHQQLPYHDEYDAGM